MGRYLTFNYIYAIIPTPSLGSRVSNWAQKESKELVSKSNAGTALRNEVRTVNKLMLLIISSISLTWGQGIPGDVAPPTASASKVNPFVDTVEITLHRDKIKGDSGQLWYDLDNQDPFDTNKSILYPEKPIQITASTVMRVVVCYKKLEQCSEPAEFTYTKDKAPTVTLLNPTTEQILRQGVDYSFSVLNALDADGPVAGVKYYRQAAGGTTWELLGQSTIGPSYLFNWTPTTGTGTGPYLIHAAAYDQYGATGLSLDVPVTLTLPNMAPIVNIKTPKSDASFSNLATISLTASASDQDAVGGGISKVEFYAGPNLLSTVTVAPYSFDWTSVPTGIYVLSAKAYDNNSPPAISTSPEVNIVVQANKPPQVSIIKPADGSFYYAPAKDTIRVSASDSDGTISKVEFYNGSVLEATDISPPYQLVKSKIAAGTYHFTAKAYDNLGASSISSEVTITVSANQPPVVNAGNDTTIVLPNTSLILNGTATDPEGTGLTYTWTVPTGVTLNNSSIARPTATINGGEGKYTLTLKATDAGTPPTSATALVVITLQSKPTITSGITASGAALQAFTYTLTATGYPVPTLNATGMPSWLHWTSATAILAGTPPAMGSFPITISATNVAGFDSKTLTIVIGSALTKPTLTSVLSTDGRQDNVFSYSITATGTDPITFSTTGTLPPGLTLSGSTISGTPTATGNYTVSLIASNLYGTDAKTLAIAINSDPKLTLNLPDSIVVFDKDPAAFTVNATGFPAVSYQWEYAGTTNLFGAIGTNSPAYNIAAVSPSSAGKYHVIVKNGTGPDITSKTCILVVKPLPLPIVIVLQPVAQTLVVGKTFILKSRATGDTTLKYQWFRGTAFATAPPSPGDSTFIISAVALSDANLYRVRVSNKYTDFTKPSTFAVSDTARLTVILPKLPPPKANPAANSFYPSIKVVLSDDIAGTTLYYTKDGTPPTTLSAKFLPGDTLSFSSTTTVKAIAVKSGYQNSDEMTATYTYTLPGQVEKPAIVPLAATFKIAVSCTLTTATAGAEIWYTTDGSSPSGATAQKFSGSLNLTATTTIMAIARKSGLLSSDTLIKTYTLEKPLSKVLEPSVTPPPGSDFPPLGKVTLASATDSASIYYTTDSTTPDTSATRKLYNPITGIILTKTAFLQAVATRSGFINSRIVGWKFNLTPTLTANPTSGTIFETDTTLRLTSTPPGATIRFTTDGTKATATSPVFPSGGLKITATTTISTLATLDGISSEATFSYTKKGGQLAPPAPVTVDNATTFKDSLKISLAATPGSTIYFTTNGDQPTIGSQKFLNAFWIDTTTTVQAIASMPNFETSKILFATYSLVPEAPTITPSGGAYSAAQKVSMSTTSKRSSIFYTLNGQDPDPVNRIAYKSGDSLLINRSTILKAIAVAGNMASPIKKEDYSIFGIKDTLLQPGDNYFLEGGYVLTNPGGQEGNVQIRLASADSLHVKGFDGVQYSISLTLSNAKGVFPVPPFPKVVLTRSTSEKRALYKVEPSGLIYFISGADSVTLNQAGNYFMGIDVSPPVITYLSEKIVVGDSTSVSFQVSDNVANLTYDLKRNDNPGFNVNEQSILSPARLGFSLKLPVGTLKPLTLQLIVSDYQLSSYFPKDGRSTLSLSQSIGALKGPPIWKVGTNQKHPFDLISIPLALDPQLTLDDLKKTQSDADLEGVRWSNSSSQYLPIDPSEVLKPGQSYWIASHKLFNSLNLTTAKTSAHGPDKFSIKLVHGWNQVASPYLENLYWPVTRTVLDQYLASPIKGLWGYDASTAKYHESEVLEPWRGYFVYCYLDESVVELSNEPFKVDALSKSSPASGDMQLSLGWGTARTLRLGAAHSTSDDLGFEDELELPRGMSMSYLLSMRKGKGLASDWIRLQSDAVMEWKVAMGGNEDSLPPLKVLDQTLPDGFETWAVSKSRSMKFNLTAGQSIPSSGLLHDTLFIYSGPRALLARMQSLQNVPTSAPALDMAVSAQPGGFMLQLSLPARSKISATVWGLDGTRKGSLVMGPLSEGTYHFAYGTDFQSRVKTLIPGIYFLTVEIHGKDLNGRLSRKIFLNH